MKIAYSHLAQYLPDNPSIEELSNSLFQLGHEHEIEDNIFDMEFTPNRGDCLSINGLLRDLATFYTIDLNQAIYTEQIEELQIDFENLSENTCPKISFLKLEVEEIPKVYKKSLGDYFSDLDLKKNNFFTDVSNYLSYETGQPTHCYNAHAIDNKLIFDEVEKEEEFETLIDKKITLIGKNAVFTLNNKVINLAGVMGGKSTACSDDSKSVIVECAYFKPEAIIGKSVKYDIHSEASYKFERGVDYDCHESVLRRFIEIVNQHTRIKKISMISYKYKENPAHRIPVDVHKINKIIGINLTEIAYLDYLSKLGFISKDGFIKVPSFRADVRTQNDLAEEIARVIGYNNIPRSEIDISNKNNNRLRFDDIENKLRYFLLDHGFYEVINPPFVNIFSDKAIKVDNPLDSNREFLRTNITNSLIDNLLFNERRQKDSIKLFEISDIYTYRNNQINKTRKLAIIASGRAGHNYEDFSKKINKEYLTKAFNKALPSENFNFKIINRDSLSTKIKNEIVVSENNINSFSSQLLDYMQKVKSPEKFRQYLPISELPYSKRDISFSVKEYQNCERLENYIFEFKDELLKDVFVFDYYKNEKNNEIKIGFRFLFQSSTSTITDKEVNSLINDIIIGTTKIEGISIPGLN